MKDAHQTDDIEVILRNLDVGIFERIPTQSAGDDRAFWLAVQRSVREANVGYTYLEIGSHLGGSLQQHVVDPKCKQIYSIDKRPLEMPDDRSPGYVAKCEGNSTERMLQHLRRIPHADVAKIRCFDCDASDVAVSSITESPDFCFIDGEHTYSAVLSDFEFCLKVCSPNAAICFHDRDIVWRALETIVRGLKRQRVRFSRTKVAGISFLIGIGNCAVVNDEYVSKLRDGVRWLAYRRASELGRRLIPEPLHAIVRPIWKRVAPD